MATDTQIIEKVRRRVSDFTDPFEYEDQYYLDAIAFALSKLSFDFDVTYSASTDVPPKHEFLLVKLASLEMCYVRASAGATGEDEAASGSKFTSIAVPDLSVSDGNTGTSRGPAYWMELAKQLQDEYDGELARAKVTIGEVEQGYTHRISLSTGGYRKRTLDPGPEATVVGTPTVDGSDVVIAWSKIRAEDFLRYEVRRSSFSTMKNATVAGRVFDNHELEFIDEGVASGTWYYRVYVLNRNMLETPSNTVSATVP